MRIHLLALFAAFSSCEERSDQIPTSEEPLPRETILGTWKSDPVDGEWGESSIVMTFTDDGRFIGSVDFTDSGSIPLVGTYKLGDGTLHRTIEGKTDEIEYHIDGATMHQSIGDENYTFKRQAEQDAAGQPATPPRVGD